MTDQTGQEPGAQAASTDQQGQASTTGSTTGQASTSTGDQQGTNDKGQEPKTFDAEYVAKLRREAAQHRTEAQQYKAKVEEFEQANMTAQQKVEAEKAKAEQRAATAELTALRYEVALEKKLDRDAMEFLTGSTKEELEQKADKLLAMIGSNGAGNGSFVPNFDAGAGSGQQQTGGDMNSLLRAAAGRPA